MLITEALTQCSLTITFFFHPPRNAEIDLIFLVFFDIIDSVDAFHVGEVVDVEATDTLEVDDIGDFQQGQYYWLATVLHIDNSEYKTKKDGLKTKRKSPQITIRWFSEKGGASSGSTATVPQSSLRKRRFATPGFPFREGDTVEWMHTSGTVWLRAKIVEPNASRGKAAISILDDFKEVSLNELSIVESSCT